MRRVAAAIALTLVAACASDGRTLRAPPPGATAPTLTTTTVKGTKTTSAPLTLASPAFAPDGPVPIENTCDGENASPPLSWGAVPEGTVELAITVTDPDAGGFVHWVLAVINPSVQALSIGDVPEGAVQTTNDAGTVGWTGPCPPKGGGVHHYDFTLYALTSPSGVTEDMTGKEAVATIQRDIGVTAHLTGTYERPA